MTRAKILRRGSKARESSPRPPPPREQLALALPPLEGINLRRAIEATLAFHRSAKCEACGRWNYHLVTCSWRSQ